MSEQQLSAQIAGIAVNYNIGEFIDGQKDCRDGMPHKQGMTESYDRGYSCQYELERMVEAR